MKRSEMLQRIFSKVCDIRHDDPEGIRDLSQDCEDILALIEEAGMLPPVQEHSLPLAYKRFKEHCSWQPENEGSEGADE